VVRAIAGRWTGTTVSDLPEVVRARHPGSGGYLRRGRRDVKKHPVRKIPVRRVRIMHDQREAARPCRSAGRLERGRLGGAVAGVLSRDRFPLPKCRTGESQHHGASLSKWLLTPAG